MINKKLYLIISLCVGLMRLSIESLQAGWVRDIRSFLPGSDVSDSTQKHQTSHTQKKASRT